MKEATPPRPHPAWFIWTVQGSKSIEIADRWFPGVQGKKGWEVVTNECRCSFWGHENVPEIVVTAAYSRDYTKKPVNCTLYRVSLKAHELSINKKTIYISIKKQNDEQNQKPSLWPNKIDKLLSKAMRKKEIKLNILQNENGQIRDNRNIKKIIKNYLHVSQ